MINNFISVIIPTFNSEKFLSRALDSLICQDYQNFEIIIIDNFSSDKTQSILEKYSLSLDIKFIKKKNEGIISKSRNLGILKSKGNLISFLDSDDFWDKKKLLRMNEIFNTFNYDVCCHKEIKIDMNGIKHKNQKNFIKSDNLYYDLLMFGNSLSTSAVTIKKDFLKKYNLFFDENENYISAEDYDLWLELSKNNANFFFANEYLGFYQYYEKSISNSNLDNHLLKVKNVLASHLSMINDKKVINLTKARIKLSELKLILKRKKIKKFLFLIKEINLNNFFYIFLFILLKLKKNNVDNR